LGAFVFRGFGRYGVGVLEANCFDILASETNSPNERRPLLNENILAWAEEIGEN
jgi:hypothetical protein